MTSHVHKHRGISLVDQHTWLCEIDCQLSTLKCYQHNLFVGVWKRAFHHTGIDTNGHSIHGIKVAGSESFRKYIDCRAFSVLRP